MVYFIKLIVFFKQIQSNQNEKSPEDIFSLDAIFLAGLKKSEAKEFFLRNYFLLTC
jgi:hypothetical protein